MPKKPVTKRISQAQATHEGQITDREEYIKHYAPDTTAIIYWLKNRQPQNWRDTREIEMTGAGGGPLVIRTNAMMDEDDG